MKKHELKTREIADLALASFLATEGHTFLGVRPRNSDHAVFVFPASEKLEEDILAFYNRKAKVDPLTFAETLRNFKAVAKKL